MGSIFTEMVMTQAINDKEEQANAELKVAEGVDFNQIQKIDEYGGLEKNLNDSLDSDDDYNDMGDYQREYKEARSQKLRAEVRELQDNKSKGHGEYSEIT